MHRMHHNGRASGWLRAAGLALTRALYTLFVALLAAVAVGLIAALTASFINVQQCRPWSAPKHCQLLMDMLGLDSTAV